MECIEHLNAVEHAIESARVRAKWYQERKEPRYLSECIEWIEVAIAYSKELLVP